MNTKRMSLGLALAIVSLACLVAQPAFAGPAFPMAELGKVMARGVRVAGSHGKVNLPGMSRVLRNSSGSLGHNLGRSIQRGTHGSIGNGSNIAGALGDLLGKNSGNWGGLNGLNGLNGLGGLGGLGNYPFNSGYGQYGRQEDGMANAYREVGIANAVVGLVGIAAQASQYNRYAQPAGGQWTRERVLVSPAHYETSQVWIPESFDPRTGARIGGGFYETRTQYVPEVYQEREVRMVSPATPQPMYAPSQVPYGAYGQ